VGYAGGKKLNPTYHDLGDHTEAFQIDYDPAVISYEKLLSLFWNNRASCRAAWSRQYMSAIFYHNDEQKKLALETKKAVAATGKEVHAEILPVGTFTLAEDYHQKYMLRNDRVLMREFKAMYPNDADFVNSTAAARVNGYLGGGRRKITEAELRSLGLSPDGEKYLRKQVEVVEPAAAVAE